jgi:prepilin-type N-terminal cleavage/methylation domain-containing protein
MRSQRLFPRPLLRSRLAASPPRRRRAAFTLLELLIVVALFSALAVIALPRINYTTMRLDANVAIVRGAMQQAWRMAITKQHDVLVSFDTSAGRMRILEDLNGDSLASAGERVMWRPLQERVRFDTPPTGVTGVVATPIAGLGVRIISAMPTVIFRRSGAASGDIEVYLQIRNRGTKSWRAITVSHATGRAEWFKFVNSNWRSGGI